MKHPRPGSEDDVDPIDPIDPIDETYQVRISALVDGQLDPDLLHPTLDYLVGTPSARRFYREARALDGLLQGAGQSPARTRPPLGLWQRIEEASVRADPSDSAPHPASRARRLRALPPWLLAVAASVLLLTVGLAWPEVWQQLLPSRQPSEPPQVVLGERAGEMSEDRFVALATELLQADERYRREMLTLMAAIENEPLAELTTEENRRGD